MKIKITRDDGTVSVLNNVFSVERIKRVDRLGYGYLIETDDETVYTDIISVELIMSNPLKEKEIVI